MAEFIKGLELSEGFFRDAVEPLVHRFDRNMKYSAGLVGFGSDVLGYDSEISRDHMWGPRLYLFLPESELGRRRGELGDYLSENLPPSFRGYPVNFSRPDGSGIRRMEKSGSDRVDHLILITSLEEMFSDYLGFLPFQSPSSSQWLTTGEHRLLAMTSGGVFRDDLDLAGARLTISSYPRDIRLFLMSSLWRMISEKEAFVGRAGDTGDDLGSRLNAAAITGYLMRLGFLWEGRYAPYGKWFGRAFRELTIAEKLLPPLADALNAGTWQAREEALCRAYQVGGEEQNRLDLCPGKPEVRIVSYYDRPYRVIFAERFSRALEEGIGDPVLRNLPKVGSVSHFSDVCPLYDDRGMTDKLHILYE